jgi:hypothetical protein
MKRKVICPVCQEEVYNASHWVTGGVICPGAIIIMNKIPADKQSLIAGMTNDYIDRMPKMCSVKVMDLAKLLKEELQVDHAFKANFNHMKDFIRIMFKERLDTKKDVVTSSYSWTYATNIQKV